MTMQGSRKLYEGVEVQSDVDAIPNRFYCIRA